jgi:hypothetical protein
VCVCGEQGSDPDQKGFLELHLMTRRIRAVEPGCFHITASDLWEKSTHSEIPWCACSPGGSCHKNNWSTLFDHSSFRNEAVMTVQYCTFQISLPLLLLFVWGTTEGRVFFLKKHKNSHYRAWTKTLTRRRSAATITRRLRRKNGRRIDNFAIKNDDLIKTVEKHLACSGFLSH